MRTVLNIGAPRAWPKPLGSVPWPLVQLGNRPLLEYWFELSVDLGALEVHLILGEGAEQIESYAGDGSRWGLRIQYGFHREEGAPLAFLQRNPELWRGGVLFLHGPLFPRRLPDFVRAPPDTGFFWHGEPNGNCCVLCRDAASVDVLLSEAASDAANRQNFSALGMAPVPVESLRDFFAINMRLAGGEISRYLAPGYGAADGSCVGYNVVLPPSAEVAPSVILGNDCPVGRLASVGPCAVIGNHVRIGRQAQLSQCVVLSDTYVGEQVEIREKIAAGNRLIDPEDGVVLELEDTWLLARMPPAAAPWDAYRAAVGWSLALVLLCLQAIPCAVLYGLIRLCGCGRLAMQRSYSRRGMVRNLPVFRPAEGRFHSLLVRLFYAGSLDLAPRLFGAVRGQWRLCGHEPLRAPEDQALRDELKVYFPAVFSYATARSGADDPAVAAMEARYYAEHRGILEDLRILRDTLWGRLASSLRKRGAT